MSKEKEQTRPEIGADVAAQLLTNLKSSYMRTPTKKANFGSRILYRVTFGKFGKLTEVDWDKSFWNDDNNKIIKIRRPKYISDDLESDL